MVKDDRELTISALNSHSNCIVSLTSKLEGLRLEGCAVEVFICLLV